MLQGLIYLHGFLSSPNSHKATILADYVRRYHSKVEISIPSIPFEPEQAWSTLCELIESCASKKIGLVGSSLGGYYATALAEKYDCRAVLVNPAVHPYELLQNYLGEYQNPYSGETFEVRSEHMQQLRALNVPWLAQPQRFWLLQQCGDEILDYHQALDRYRMSRVTLEQGGNHAFVEFERYLAQILCFLDH